jgi:hypothetical protein
MRNFRGAEMKVRRSTLIPVKRIVNILFDPQLGRVFRTHRDYQNVSLLVCKWTLLSVPPYELVDKYPSDEHAASVLKVQKRRPEHKTEETVKIAVM